MSAKETMFKKRSGTSSMSGQLYETKLTSLVLFKLLHDDRFEYFYLASFLDDVDCFSNLCFKAKIKGLDRPLLVFLQTRHKDDDNSFVDFGDVKSFHDSYLKVVQKFNSSNESESNDKIFNGKFEENECIFVLHTNAKYNRDSGVDFKSPYANIFNELLATAKNGTHLNCTDKIIEDSAEAIVTNEIKTLAEHIFMFLNFQANDSMQIMLDDYISKYHVILASNVFDVSEIQSDEQKTDLNYRVLTFRESFFNSNDTHLLLLKKEIYERALQNQVDVENMNNEKDSKLEEQIRTFFENPCASTLSPLIGGHIENKYGKLAFISQRSEDEIQQLNQTYLSDTIIEEAEAIATHSILLNIELKVPVTFGNIDLIISESRLDEFTESIVSLCNQFKQDTSYKFVTLDESNEDGFISVNGGLAGAVGNLLVYDEDTKLLKFTDHCSPQQKNAYIILTKLKSSMTFIHEYRFKVKEPLLIPKLSFDFNAEAKEILHKVVVYARQSNHNGIDTILKKLIENHHDSIASLTHIQPASMFLNYHSEVQDWWLLSDDVPYLTKESNIYQRAINNIAIEPQINLLKYTFHVTKMKEIEYTTKSLESLERLSKEKCEKGKPLLPAIRIVVTDVTTLTTMKVIQYLQSKSISQYAVLDLETLVTLSTDDFCALKEELKNTDKVIIIICDNLQSGRPWYERYLIEIAQMVEKKEKIVITNKLYLTIILNAFTLSDKIKEDINQEYHDEIMVYEKHSLTDLAPELRKTIIKNNQILFQGQLLNLESFLDDISAAFVEGTVLNKIISNKTDEIRLGDSLSTPDYEKISHLYQERVVEYVSSYIIPGKVLVSNVDSVSDDSLKYPDSCVDSSDRDHFFCINLLDDRVNDTNLDTGNNNKDPDCIKFNFTCRVSPKQLAEPIEAVNIIIQVKDKDDPSIVTNRVSVKKTDIASKIWTVEITLLDYTRRFREWLKNDIAPANIMKTLKYMCRGAVFSYIIENENVEVYSALGGVNKETMNYLFKDETRNHFWCDGNHVDYTLSESTPKHVISTEGSVYHWTKDNPNVILSESLQKDAGNNIASTSNDRQIRQGYNSNFTLDDMQKYIRNYGLTGDKQKEPNSNNNKQEANKDFSDMDTATDCDSKVTTNCNAVDDNSKDELPTCINIAKINLQADSDHSKRSNILKDYVKFLNFVLAGNHFSLISDIPLLINDKQEHFNRDKNTPKDKDFFQSKSKDKDVHDFNIRFHCKHRIDLKSFDDIKDDIVLLTAKPGVGKSTLLTHLSQKFDNNLWILRVNLIKYSGQFNKWQNDKSNVIDILNILNLMFKIILGNKNITVELKSSSSKVNLEYCSGDDWDRFHLNMFIHYFNQGKLLFLFDGFDEICPDYKDEVIKFLNVIKDDPRKNKMWITSRAYNSILPDLEKNFGRTYKLDYFDEKDQKQFLKIFWDHNHSRSLNEYNWYTLVGYLAKIIIVLDNKLKMICYDFYDYLVTSYDLRESLESIPELKLCNERIEKVYHELNVIISKDYDLNNKAKSGVYEFLGTPLLLYLAASFFEAEILNISKVIKEEHSVYNLTTMYQWCIEIKLKDIFFENKCGIDVNMPLTRETYDQELKERINLHKKLGAHAIFGSPLFKKKGLYFEEFKDLAPFNIDDANGRKEFDDIVNRIRQGKDITGLISYVADDGTPIFIHKTFAEYFAYDYVCDILKSEVVDFNTKRLILIVILTLMHTEIVIDEHCNLVSSRGLGTWIQERTKVDKEVERIGTEILNKHPLIINYVASNSKEENSMLKHVYIRLMNSTSDDYENPALACKHMDSYLSKRREIDLELFKLMKPHFRKKFPQFTDDIQF